MNSSLKVWRTKKTRQDSMGLQLSFVPATDSNKKKQLLDLRIKELSKHPRIESMLIKLWSAVCKMHNVKVDFKTLCNNPAWHKERVKSLNVTVRCVAGESTNERPILEFRGVS